MPSLFKKKSRYNTIPKFKECKYSDDAGSKRRNAQYTTASYEIAFKKKDIYEKSIKIRKNARIS